MKTDNWITVRRDVDSIDWKGNDILLKNIPTQYNEKTKATRIFLDDVIKGEQEYIAKEHGLDPRQIHELLLLYAESRFFKGGYIKQKFRFNKMLFVHWQEMKKRGFEDSYIFDEFVCGRAGPIPKNLKSSMEDLSEKKLVRVKWSHKPLTSSEFTLTDKGKEIAKAVWDKTPDDIKMLIIKSKEETFLVDATQLKELIHKKYPEFKRTYIELDKED